MSARSRNRGAAWRLAIFFWAGLVFTFLMTPLLIVFPISFSSSPYLQFPPPGYSLRWYEAYLNDHFWMEATWRSLKIGAVTMVLATILGTMLAFALVRGRFRGRGALGQLANTPLLVPTIIYSVAIYSVFAEMQLIGDWRGIVLAHTVMAIPYVVIVVGAALKTVDPRLEQAAIGLGASRLTAVRRVTLPIIRPAVISAMFLAFVSSFDELVVAMFLGGTNMTLPKKMFDNIMNEIDPTIAAVSVLQIVLVCIALWLSHRFGSGLKPV